MKILKTASPFSFCLLPSHLKCVFFRAIYCILTEFGAWELHLKKRLFVFILLGLGVFFVLGDNEGIDRKGENHLI